MRARRGRVAEKGKVSGPYVSLFLSLFITTNMPFAVTIVSPPNYPHTEAVREVAESIYYGLVSLGHDTILTARTACPGRRSGSASRRRGSS
jgi:hypothetical protein